MDQVQVDAWLDRFLAGLRERFGKRVVFVANHGSWARREARADSDIDVFVILDEVGEADLAVYGEFIAEMSAGGVEVSTFFGSAEELRLWPRYEQIQCWHGCKVLWGDLAEWVEPPRREDYVEDVRIKAAENLHHGRHYLLHPHDLSKVVHRLLYPYKECTYALRSWMILQDGKYYERREDLLEVLSDADDRAVVEVARDWHKSEADRTARPGYYVRLLERWSRRMLQRVGEAGGPAPVRPAAAGASTTGCHQVRRHRH